MDFLNCRGEAAEGFEESQTVLEISKSSVQSQESTKIHGKLREEETVVSMLLVTCQKLDDVWVAEASK